MSGAIRAGFQGKSSEPNFWVQQPPPPTKAGHGEQAQLSIKPELFLRKLVYIISVYLQRWWDGMRQGCRIFFLCFTFEICIAISIGQEDKYSVPSLQQFNCTTGNVQGFIFNTRTQIIGYAGLSLLFRLYGTVKQGITVQVPKPVGCHVYDLFQRMQDGVSFIFSDLLMLWVPWPAPFPPSSEGGFQRISLTN